VPSTRRQRTPAAAWIALALAVVLVDARFAFADDNPWDKGSQWLTVRAGYANAGQRQVAEGQTLRDEDAFVETGGGFLGYGMGYQRMLNKRWALGVFVQHDVLGKQAASADIEVPVTVELTRHFSWQSTLRPYLGFGGGMFYRKQYRTGDDSDETVGGVTVNGGANAAIGGGQLFGLDVRYARLNEGTITWGHLDSSGAFVAEEDETLHEGHWSVKLGWSLTY
jgi:Outer membrane protein beta-barrel domain